MGMCDPPSSLALQPSIHSAFDWYARRSAHEESSRISPVQHRHCSCCTPAEDHLEGVPCSISYIIIWHSPMAAVQALRILYLLSLTGAHAAPPMIAMFSSNFPHTAGGRLPGSRKALELIGLLFFGYVHSDRLFPAGWKIISLQFYYFERITSDGRNSRKGPFIGALTPLLSLGTYRNDARTRTPYLKPKYSSPMKGH